MSISELRQLSLKQLRDLSEKVSSVMAEKERAERSRTRAELAKFAQARGFSLDEIFFNGHKKKRIIVPKWRHPKNPSLTWSGMGRKPKWFDERTAVAL